MEEQPTKSITPSSLDTPKSNAHMPRTSTECSTGTGPSHHNTSKAILNVGGVRHEGNFLKLLLYYLYVKVMFIRSIMAYISSSTKYSSGSFSTIT
jgi:hypothetical protein